jgi:serine/threonine-protein kinase HipA
VGLTWSIDPVNLPFIRDLERIAPRYNGLHDVLRDACPDTWGKMLIQREHGIPADSHDARYLALSRNADRWGALAVGTHRHPSIAELGKPRLPQLEALAQELVAIFERKPPPINAKLRKRLVATPSLGGARPKATVQDTDRFWLVKPYLPTDTVDIALLEHFTQQWGIACGLDFAETVHHRPSNNLSVVRVLRFDHHGERRVMPLSGASLLETQYTGSGTESSHF